MSDTENRREIMVNSLREMADLLESSSLPVPYGVYMTVYGLTIEAARECRKGIYGWRKSDSEKQSFTEYTKQVGGTSYGAGAVTYSMSINKSETCEQVQVGTRHVDAVEAHDEPVYEWKCS